MNAPRQTLGRTLLCVLAGALFAVAALGARQSAQPPGVDLEQRLAGLSPDEPLEYFLLAEEVAYEAQSRAETDLAIRLFLLATHLDAEDGVTTSLARSSCIALRDLTTDEQLHRLLAGLEAYYANAPVEQVLQAAHTPYEVGPPGTQDDIDTALETLSEYRLGQGRSAAARFRQPDVQRVLKPYESAIGGLDELITWGARHPACRQCDNQRVIMPGPRNREVIEPRLCPTCEGVPGPNLSDERLDDQLRLELALRQNKYESWSTQLALQGGTPLAPIDLSAVAELLDVDLARTTWRDGAWREE
jgi:hypothetical protein